LGVKQTLGELVGMSAFDPKLTRLPEARGSLVPDSYTLHHQYVRI